MSTTFILKQSVVFLYDGWNMIAEIDTTTSARLIRSYEWGTDLSGTMDGAGGVGGLLVLRTHPSTINAQPSTGAYAPTYDGNGNVMELVNLANGSVSARYEYGAFGETISVDGGAVADANPIRLSTKYTDAETGWCYYGYRYYDAVNGRWPNRDPIGDLQFYRAFVAGRPDEEMNKWREAYFHSQYNFVSNDPINTFDLLGLVDREFFKPNSWEETDQSFYDDGSDVYDIGAHGNPSSIFDQNTGRSLSAQQLYDIIKNDALFKCAKKIKLWACSTGRGDSSFAQQLANLTCKKVVAPTDILWAGDELNDGKAHVDPPKDRNDPNSPRTGNPLRQLLQGRWKTFKPKN